MCRQVVWCYVFMLTLVEISLNTKLTALGKSHDIIHDTLIDGITFQEWGEEEHHNGEALGILEEGALRLQPPALHFGELPLAIPHALIVTLFNAGNHTLHLTSVNGNTPDFHASFFDSKTLPPQENTSFSIVYLGRREGPVNATLELHTSLGIHKYEVTAVGAPNEYRVWPVLVLRVPANGTAETTITLHNPDDEPLQLTHAHSSATWLTLEPASERPGDRAAALWTVPPHSARPVLRLRASHAPGRAYVRLKSNRRSLLVTVETVPCAALTVAVEDAAGALAGTGDGGAERAVWASNAASVSAQLSAHARLSCGSHDTSTHVELHTYTLPAHASNHRVATLHMRWSPEDAGRCHGEVSVNEESAPLELLLLPGTLKYNNITLTTSRNDARAPIELTATNEFQFPVYLSELSVPGEIDEHFHRTEFVPRALPVGAQTTLTVLTLRAGAKPELSSQMILRTNVTAYSVAVLAYSGALQLEWEWPEPGSWKRSPLDLGLLSLSRSMQVHGRLINSGPLPLCADVQCSITGTTLGLKDSCVRAHSTADVTLTVSAPPTPASLQGKIIITTPHAVTDHLVVATVDRGALRAHPLRLQRCAPYSWCNVAVKVSNTFQREMILTDTVGKEPAIKHVVLESQKSIAMGDSTLGVVLYAPEITCQPACYTGIPENSTDYISWHERMRTMKSGTEEEISDALREDIRLWKTRRRLYQSARLETEYELDLRTDAVASLKLRAETRSEWPRLSARRADAGVAALRAPRIFTVLLRNPSDSHPVLLQPVPLPKRGELPRDPAMGDACERRGGCSFSAGIFRLLEWERDGRLLDRSALVLAPAGSAMLRVAFAPTEERVYAAPLYVRNNLTVLEMIPLRGRGAAPRLRLANRAPGSDTPLVFEVRGDSCDDPTVRRELTLRNAGRVGVRVIGFEIEGESCGGGGFRIECSPFRLSPNRTRRLETAYSPDFTLTVSRVKLRVYTEPGETAEYVLQGVTPRELLQRCGAKQERPAWEARLRWAARGLAVLGLLSAAAGAMMDAGRALGRQGPRDTAPLDLRAAAFATTRGSSPAPRRKERPPRPPPSSPSPRTDYYDFTSKVSCTAFNMEDCEKNADASPSATVESEGPPRPPTPPQSPPSPPPCPRALRHHKQRPRRPPGDPPRRLSAPQRREKPQRRPRPAPSPASHTPVPPPPAAAPPPPPAPSSPLRVLSIRTNTHTYTPGNIYDMPSYDIGTYDVPIESPRDDILTQDIPTFEDIFTRKTAVDMPSHDIHISKMTNDISTPYDPASEISIQTSDMSAFNVPTFSTPVSPARDVGMYHNVTDDSPVPGMSTRSSPADTPSSHADTPTPPALGPIAPPADHSLFYFNRAITADRWQDAYSEESSGTVGPAVWSPPSPPSPPCWAWGWGRHLAPPPGFTQTPGVRAYDPFQSLSSIWAEDTTRWTGQGKEDDPAQ